MKKIITLGILLPLMAALLPGFSPAALAQATGVPEISMYYPGNRESDPMELKPGAKAYIYFKNGAKVNYAKARLVQENAQLGVCVYRANNAANPGTVVVLDPALDENSALNSLAEGIFSLEVYEVNYIDSEAGETTYTAEGDPIGTVVYKHAAESGTIVSESGFEGRTILSYYPTDGTEGVKVFTFSKPVDPEGLNPTFEYGSSTTYCYTRLPWTLSDDGMTLTIDLRGKCYNPDVLAPGVTFYDQDGNPTDPPTSINLTINTLKALDGSQFVTVSESLDGQYSTELRGRLHQSYHYQDLTFPTPYIESVLFYAKNSPLNTYLNINDATDMVKLSILNSNYIESADVKFAFGTVTATVAHADIARASNTWRMDIPAEILALGSSNLIISLDNVVYTEEDGADHTILPWNMSGTTPEVSSIAALKAMNPGEDVVFNLGDGITVTLSNDSGYTFAEDETGGMMVLTPDYTRLFNEGVTVTGKLTGSYQGYGMFMVYPDQSEFTEQPVDAPEGLFISSMEELESPALDFRLVSFDNTDSTPITVEEGYIIIGGAVPVIMDFFPGYEFPEKVVSATGVLYRDANLGMCYILPRSENDVVGGTTAIGTVGTDIDEGNEAYDLRGVRVGGNARGIIITKGRKTFVR